MTASYTQNDTFNSLRKVTPRRADSPLAVDGLQRDQPFPETVPGLT